MFCFGPVQIIFLGNKSEKKKFSNTLDDLRHNEMEATISYLDGQKSVEKEKDELETKRLKLSINFLLLQFNLLKKAQAGIIHKTFDTSKRFSHKMYSK